MNKNKNREKLESDIEKMTNEQKQKYKDYRREYYKKYYAAKKLNNNKIIDDNDNDFYYISIIIKFLNAF